MLLVAALVGIGVLAYLGSKRLPARDWAFTVDADVVGRHLGWTAIPTPRPEAVFGWASFEKIALLTLVSAIFGQVLESSASGLELLAGVALVVLVNAAIANWRIGRGYQWRSTFVQFLVLSVANLAVIGAFAALVSGDDAEFSLPRALFFALLLTLIIVLFDRYRRIRSARLVERGEIDDADPVAGFAAE